MKKTQIALNRSFVKDLVWMASRYCIGRHTIAASMMPCDIASNYYKEMDERERFMLAKDIRRQLTDVLNWENFILIHNICSEVGEDAISELLKTIKEQELMSLFDQSNVKYELDLPMYGNPTALRHDIKPDWETKKLGDFFMNYCDYLPWIKLANALDQSRWKDVEYEYVDDQGKTIHNTEKMFHWYNINRIQKDGEVIAYEIVERWNTLDNYLTRCGVESYISPEYIKSIK